MRRWSSAQRRISSPTASGAQAASAAACASSHAKNSGSRISATLTASAMPATVSRRPRLSRNRRSLMTANGGAKVPRKFFTPKALTPFFTPTPESSCASTVVGSRTVRIPRCAVAAA